MKRLPAISWFIAAAIVGTFALDMITPHGWSAWIAYLVAIGAGYWLEWRWVSLYLAAFCSALVVVGLVCSPPGVAVEADLLNRSIGAAVFGFVGFLVERQKKLSNALRFHSEERLRQFLDTAATGLLRCSRDLRYRSANAAFARLAGRPLDQIVGRPFEEVIGAEAVETIRPHIERVLRGERVEYEAEVPLAASGRRWLHVVYTPDCNDQGEVIGWVSSITDITDRKRAEEALQSLNESLEQQVAERTRELQDRTQRLRAILYSTVDAIITIDYEGIIREVNPATERLFGYGAAELIGQSIRILMPAPYHDEHNGYIANYLRTGIKKIMCVGREVVARRKDGSVFPADLAVNEIPQLRLFTGIIRDISRRKELERYIVEIASLEQRRIGQDLHDTVSQELTALRIQAADLAAIVLEDPAGAAKVVAQMIEGLRRSQEDLRAVMRGLLPVAVDAEGLMVALSELADRTQREGKVTCTFTCAEPVAFADNHTATHLYLIAQEAVHNASKHARPRNIHIGLESTGQVLNLGVEDDGAGIGDAMRGTPDASGLGLRIMRNRAAIIGATLTITLAPPSGTRVLCTLPRK